MANRITMGPLGFFGLALGFMATIGGSYWMGQQNNDKDPLEQYNVEFDAYQDSVVKPILAQADSLKRVADSTKSIADSAQFVANRQTGEITKLRSTVAVLRQQNTALGDSVKNDTTLPPACDQCRRAVVSLTQEVDSLNKVVVQQEVRDTTRVVAITQLNTSLLASNTRGDSLQKVIINFPAPPKPNRFLGVTLPRIPSQYVIIGAIGTGILIAR
jgi:uncharacterized membrane-anchored protein YhcB (DUF1043 family)